MAEGLVAEGVETRDEQELKVLRAAGVRYQVTSKRIVLSMPHRDASVADRYVFGLTAVVTVLLFISAMIALGGSVFGGAAIVVALLSPLWLGCVLLSARILGEIAMKQTVEMSAGGLTVTREYPMVTNRVEMPYGQVRGVGIRAAMRLRLVSQLLYRRDLGPQVEDCVQKGASVVVAPVQLPVIDYGSREVFFAEYLEREVQEKVVEIVSEAVERIGAS